jgi:HEAT repeat protein
MGIFDKILAKDKGPSSRQLRRALKQVTQIHGDAATRVSAMERLAEWRSPEAIAALLRRFTVQVAQGSMDLEEKQFTVRLLAQIGHPAVEPILQYLQTEGEVTWPVRALREILPHEEFYQALKSVLEKLASGYTRWPEAKTVLIEHLPDQNFPEVRDTVLKFLADDNDDVCIAAADYLARNADEEVRERLIQTMLDSEQRPRVRGRILDLFCEREWQVKGFKKRVEEIIAEPFYLTSKGTVKRRQL